VPTGVDEEDIALVGEEVGAEDAELTEERYQELKAREQFVLTVSERGFGKRLVVLRLPYLGSWRQGHPRDGYLEAQRDRQLVAAFPVEDTDQIMLVSNGGQLIRVPVDGIRIASRATKGVTIFSTAKDERVVSVERVSEPEQDDDEALVPEADSVAERAEADVDEAGGEAPQED
jgi:DNA gyrase subunit A